MSSDPLNICTIITKSHISFARSLAQTFKQFHPDGNLWVLLADSIDGYIDPSKEPFNLIRLSDLPNQNDIEPMCFYYSPFELCCALRGHLHDYMWKKTNAPFWLFLDSDIMLTSNLDEITKEFEKASILLSPHITAPVNTKYTERLEIKSLRFGIYNAGFLGLKRTEISRAFISWFQKRLPIYAFENPDDGQYTDQLLLDHVPIFFNEVSKVSHPGVNVGRWNLHERKLSKDGNGKIMANGNPLIFCHFSRINPLNAAQYGIESQGFCEGISNIWSDLSVHYAELLLANDFVRTRKFPYTFLFFKNGKRINRRMRDVFFKKYAFQKGAAGSPFDKGSLAERFFFELQFLTYKAKKLLFPRRKFLPC